MDSFSRQYSTYLTLQTTTFHKITFSSTSNQCADFYKLIPLPINGEFEIYAKDGRIKQLSYDGEIIVSFESVKRNDVIFSTMLLLSIILIGCYKMIQLSYKSENQ